MNPSLLGLLGVELVLILVGCTLAWLLVSWRRRTQRKRSLAELLALLENTEAERTLHYSQWLKSYMEFDDEKALIVAGNWLETEKAFWRIFLAWHLHPNPKTLPDFPHHLQRFLNARLETLAGQLSAPIHPKENPTNQPPPPDPIVQDEAVSGDNEAASLSSPEEEAPAVARHARDDADSIAGFVTEPEDDDDDILIYTDKGAGNGNNEQTNEHTSENNSKELDEQVRDESAKNGFPADQENIAAESEEKPA